MKAHHIPNYYRPGKEYDEDGRYAVTIYTAMQDTYPNNFTVYLKIRDKHTEVVTYRRGTGRFIGNFSPIFVRLDGQEMQVTQLLRIPRRNAEGRAELIEEGKWHVISHENDPEKTLFEGTATECLAHAKLKGYILKGRRSKHSMGKLICELPATA